MERVGIGLRIGWSERGGDGRVGKVLLDNRGLRAMVWGYGLHFKSLHEETGVIDGDGFTCYCGHHEKSIVEIREMAADDRDDGIWYIIDRNGQCLINFVSCVLKVTCCSGAADWLTSVKAGWPML